MSKGNPIVKLRIPLSTLQEIEDSIRSINLTTAGEPLDLSAWLRSAIMAKLDHYRRSRRQRANRRARRGGDQVELESDRPALD